MLVYLLVYLMFCVGGGLSACSGNIVKSNNCFMGSCIDDKCICYDGWSGPSCDICQGRILLNESSGFIFDGPNNYTVNSKCSWLVDPTTSHTSLRLRFHEFATECGWDYLYIYDGESAFSPLIGTFNGLLSLPGQPNKVISEVVASSGKAFLQFYTDVAYNMAGFNISYSIDECRQSCSQHGNCRAGRCECDTGWYGEACDLCKTTCSDQLVACSSQDGKFCSCPNETCSSDNLKGLWFVAALNISSRGSAAVAIIDGNVWMFGGLEFDEGDGQLAVLNQTWILISSVTAPENRYEHTMVAWNNSLIVFGGKLVRNEAAVNQLWIYDVASSSWDQITYTASFGESTDNLRRLVLSGHTANMINIPNGTDIMVVLFGYNPSMTFTRFVYEYNPSTRHWVMVRPSGAIVHNLFGHTSSYYDGIIYIHGGYKLVGVHSSLSSQTFSYDPHQRRFSLLTSSGRPRYLHSASFINGVMYIYGGNTHNSANEGGEGLCYSSNFMAYYPQCDRWMYLESSSSNVHPSRYGHSSAVVHSISDPSIERMLIISGYDSTMISNMLIYLPSSCDRFDMEACIGDASKYGIVCYWNSTHCVSSQSSDSVSSCAQLLIEEKQDLCESLRSCDNCISNAYNCSFCDSKCHGPVNVSCQVDICVIDSYCSTLINCEQCEIAGCTWQDSGCVTRTGNQTYGDVSRCQVDGGCDGATTCAACNTYNDCMWCMQPEKCVPTNSYVLQFPYGQCMEWTKKDCSGYECSTHQTCETCQDYPRCGWCEHPSKTGLGECLEGTTSGAVNTTNQCLTSDWHFTSCPRCQCNGHSKCDVSNKCIECRNNTKGEHCETCVDGYYGNPVNGGECRLCQCDGKATTCQSTGECNCFTKGVTGYSCDKCDTLNSYEGNATGNGSCYYPLQVNYIYTFTLNDPVDQHITALNFKNTPPLDEDVQMSLTSQELCNVRLAVQMAPDYETTLESYVGVLSVDYIFKTRDLKFGPAGSNSTIRIYTTNITSDGKIKVSLIQRSNTLLTILLILFSSFLVILIIAAVVWKAKLMYDAYRLRMNRAIQMKEMAARPFAGVSLCCDDAYRSTQMLLSPGMDGYSPLPDDGIPDVICEEKCSDNKASVVSVFLWLPASVPSNAVDADSCHGDVSMCYLSPPPGMPALAIGTVLTAGKNVSTPASTPDLRRKTTLVGDSRADEMTVRTQADKPRAYVNLAMQPSMA